MDSQPEVGPDCSQDENVPTATVSQSGSGDDINISDGGEAEGSRMVVGNDDSDTGSSGELEEESQETIDMVEMDMEGNRKSVDMEGSRFKKSVSMLLCVFVRGMPKFPIREGLGSLLPPTTPLLTPVEG